MTEKDKIVEIILNTDVTERAADRIVNDLIENDIGDVKEWKRRAEEAERNAAEWKNRVKALCKKLREVFSGGCHEFS